MKIFSDLVARILMLVMSKAMTPLRALSFAVMVPIT